MTDGYQENELGELPSDWELVRAPKTFTRVSTRGHQLDSTDYMESGTIPIVDQGKSAIAGYTESAGLAIDPPSEGLIVFGDHTCVVKWVDFPFVVGADGVQLLKAHSHCYAPYLAQFLGAKGVQPTGYNRHFARLKQLQIALPPLSEQRRIAEVLSDVDDLLKSLDTLIAKRRAVKDAVMGDLLTGRRRLPGFDTGNGHKITEVGEIPADWDVVKLGTLATLTMGKTPPRANARYWGRGTPWVAISDMQSRRITDTREQVTTHADSLMNLVPVGTLMFSFKLSIGRVGIAGVPLYTNEAICHVRHPEADSTYLFYALQRTDFEHYGKQAVKGYTLNSESLASIEVAVPGRDEQEAIAAVLSDVDDDIDVLVRQHAKMADVKSALMDELLTGKTRLL